MIDTEVSKADLIEKIRANRQAHRAIFEQAQEQYRLRAIEELDRRLQAARDGRKIMLWFDLPEPEDHTADYDAALEMLQWEVGDTVKLDARTFRRLVLNRWEWEASFAANTRSYVGG